MHTFCPKIEGPARGLSRVLDAYDKGVYKSTLTIISGSLHLLHVDFEGYLTAEELAF